MIRLVIAAPSFDLKGSCNNCSKYTKLYKQLFLADSYAIKISIDLKTVAFPI